MDLVWYFFWPNIFVCSYGRCLWCCIAIIANFNNRYQLILSVVTDDVFDAVLQLLQIVRIRYNHQKNI